LVVLDGEFVGRAADLVELVGRQLQTLLLRGAVGGGRAGERQGRPDGHGLVDGAVRAGAGADEGAAPVAVTGPAVVTAGRQGEGDGAAQGEDLGQLLHQCSPWWGVVRGVVLGRSRTWPAPGMSASRGTP